MIRCDANLFRLATSCQSNEETRYHLRGVFIEPHPVKGVTLTATNSHRLLVIYDESGHADQSAIIRLSSDALRACRAGKYGLRALVVDGGNATVHETREGELQDAVAVSPRCIVEGSFPGYRRVIPAKLGGKGVAAFAGENLSVFLQLGLDLAAHFHGWTPRKDRHGSDKIRPDAMRLVLSDVEDAHLAPAVVLWPEIPQAFGVTVSVRSSVDHVDALPAWFNANAAPQPLSQQVA